MALEIPPPECDIRELRGYLEQACRAVNALLNTSVTVQAKVNNGVAYAPAGNVSVDGTMLAHGKLQYDESGCKIHLENA